MTSCIVCEKHIRKDQGGHSVHGFPAHKKCAIAYTAWEIQEENPGASLQKYRELQIQRHIEGIFKMMSKQ